MNAWKYTVDDATIEGTKLQVKKDVSNVGEHQKKLGMRPEAKGYLSQRVATFAQRYGR
jgi:hypothetical protein